MVLICGNYCIWCVISFWDFIVKLDKFMMITLVVHFEFLMLGFMWVGATKDLKYLRPQSQNIDVMQKGK